VMLFSSPLTRVIPVHGKPSQFNVAIDDDLVEARDLLQRLESRAESLAVQVVEVSLFDGWSVNPGIGDVQQAFSM